jgi:hypothetical protein
MFNFKILNLPECENSRLSNIHSFAVCNSKDLKDSEFSFFIDEFMKEIRLLESCNIHRITGTMRRCILVKGYSKRETQIGGYRLYSGVIEGKSDPDGSCSWWS